MREILLTLVAGAFLVLSMPAHAETPTDRATEQMNRLILNMNKLAEELLKQAPLIIEKGLREMNEELENELKRQQKRTPEPDVEQRDT